MLRLKATYFFLPLVSSIQDSNLFARFHWRLEKKNVTPRRYSQWTSIFLRGTEELQATPTSSINECGCKWNEAIWRRAVRVTNEKRLEKSMGGKRSRCNTGGPQDRLRRAKNNVAVYKSTENG